MNKGERQIIAEKISSTVRILELLGFEYQVSAPKNRKEKGNKSPRVVYVNVGEARPLSVYNSVEGHTWANRPDGKPIDVGSVEDLHEYLCDLRYGTSVKQSRRVHRL